MTGSKLEITRQHGGKMISWRNLTGFDSDPRPIVASFFTDRFYLREAFELVRTLQTHGLEYVVEQVPNRGGWYENTNFKPTFLHKLHQEFPGRALLWLDADARVRQHPDLLTAHTANIAYHTLMGQPASGTVYMRPGPQRGLILSAWEKVCEERPRATDQVCMKIAHERVGVEHVELPESYCWVFDFNERGEYCAHPSPNWIYPVIEHTQASRFSRQLMKKEKRKS